MDVTLSLLAGLGLRLVLAPSVTLDSELTEPSPSNPLVTALLGVWEGVVVHQVAGRSTSAPLDHLLAYGLRLLVDFIITKDPQRLAMVVLCSGLSAFLSEAVIPFDLLQSELKKEREKDRRHRRTRSSSTPQPPRGRAPRRTNPPAVAAPAILPPLPPRSATTLHFPPPTPPSFFLQDQETSDVFSPAPVQSKLKLKAEPIPEKGAASSPQPEDSLPARPHSGINSILETTPESGSPLPVLVPLPTPPESAQSGVPSSSEGPVDLQNTNKTEDVTPVPAAKKFDNQLYTIPEVSSPETSGTVNGNGNTSTGNGHIPPPQPAHVEPVPAPAPAPVQKLQHPPTPEPIVTPITSEHSDVDLPTSPTTNAPLPVPNAGMRGAHSTSISRWLATQSQSQSLPLPQQQIQSISQPNNVENPPSPPASPLPHPLHPPYATSTSSVVGPDTIFANPFSPESPEFDGTALPVQLRMHQHQRESTPPPEKRTSNVRGRGKERARSISRSRSGSPTFSTLTSRSPTRSPSPRAYRRSRYAFGDPDVSVLSSVSSGMESDPLRTPPAQRIMPPVLKDLKGKKKASTKTLKAKSKKSSSTIRLDTEAFKEEAYHDDPLTTPVELQPKSRPRRRSQTQASAPAPAPEDDEAAVLSPLPLDVRSMPSRGPTPSSHDELSAPETVVGPSSTRYAAKAITTTTTVTASAPILIPNPRRRTTSNDDDPLLPGSLALSISVPLSQNILLHTPLPPSGPLIRRSTSIPSSPSLTRPSSPTADLGTPIPRPNSAPPSPAVLNSPLSDISTLSTRIPNALYTRGDELRGRAKELEKARAEADEERRQAEMEGRSLEAVNLRVKVRDLEGEVQKLHEKAARRYYAARNTLEVSNQIDVHGLRPREAFDRIERAILKANTEGKTTIRVIVGKGLHSVNQVPTLKPAVIREMQRLKFSCEIDERNPGVLNIGIPR